MTAGFRLRRHRLSLIILLVSLALSVIAAAEVARPVAAVTNNSHLIASTGDRYVYESSYQNPGFYAQGLYWVFYEDSSVSCEGQGGCLLYKTSVDAVTWSPSTMVSTPSNHPIHVTDSDWSIVSDGTRAYYARYNETAFDSYCNQALLYGTGTLATNGSISWQSEQVVRNPTPTAAFPNEAIQVDSTGQVWIGYQEHDGLAAVPGSGCAGGPVKQTPRIIHANNSLPISVPPGSGFTFSPLNVTLLITETFTASASGGSGSYTFGWNFGDGNKTVTGQTTITHTYKTVGNFTVTLQTNDTSLPPQTVVSSQKIMVGPTLLPTPQKNTLALQVPTSRNIKTGTALTFKVNASDTDGESVNFHPIISPAGAAFDTSTGVFTWTPTADQANELWSISFNASDTGSPPLFITRQVLVFVSPLWAGDFALPGSVGSSAINDNWHVDIATLPNGQIYAAYWADKFYLLGRLYDGSSWGPEENISLTSDSTDVNSFVFASGTNVYAIWYDTNSGTLNAGLKTPGQAWIPYSIGKGEAKSVLGLPGNVNGHRYSLPITAAVNQAATPNPEFYVFWYNQTNRVIDEWSGTPGGNWHETLSAFTTQSSLSEFTIGSFHYSAPDTSGKNTFGVMWIDGTTSPYNLNFGLETVASIPTFSKDSSWSPRVQCTPIIVTIEQILGSQNTSLGGASESGSIFNPGILAPSPGDAKRWLTAGPNTPPGWVFPGPGGSNCMITNADGQVVSAFVEILGVQRGPLLNEDLAVRYDPANGGGLYSNPKGYNDTTFNIFTPGSAACAPVPSAAGCMHTMHMEFDHDWKAAGYCGPNTTCDPYQLAQQTAVGKTLIDFQGFVYWDPDHANALDHSFSGWEIHPITAWRLSGVSPVYSLSASPNPVTTLPGKSVNSTITINTFNLFSGPVPVNATVIPSGTSTPTATFHPSTVIVPPCNQCGIANTTLTVTALPSSSGTYSVTVRAYNGTTFRSTTITVLVQGFNMSANPQALTVPAGGSVNSTITVTSLGSFSGPVSLSPSVSGCACGFVAKVTPNIVSLGVGGKQNATLTVTAGSQTGNANITVTGNSSSLSASTIVRVAGVDFNASATPTSAIVLTNRLANSTITVAAINGFKGTVSLTDSVPTGLTCSLSPISIVLNSTATSGTSSLKCSGAVGNYTVLVNAVGNTVLHSAVFNIRIQDFTIVASPTGIVVNIGSSAISTIRVIAVNGFTGTVGLSQTGGTACSLAAPSAVLTPTTTSVNVNLTCTYVVIGNNIVVVTSKSGPLLHNATITFQVVDFTISASPTSLTVNAGSIGNSTVTLTALNGFNRTVTMSISAPPMLTCSLSPNKASLVTSPATSILSCRSSTAADYIVTVTGVNGTLSHTSTNILFHIVDFSITSLPSSSITLVVGQSSGSTSIHLGVLNGFTGTVALNVVASPNGPSATLFPASLKLIPSGCFCNASALNINAGLIAGVYTLNVTATNGLLTHWTIVTLTVTRDNPSITTTLSSTSIFAGGSVTDSAKLTGATSTASGSVAYFWFANGACTAPPTIVSVVTVSSNVIPNSRLVVFNATASYSFNATYSGDNNNSPASAPCEPLAVQKDITTITTSLSLTSITVGQSVTDSAALASFFQAGGTVSYNLFIGSATCIGTSSTVSNVTGTNGIIPNSRSVIFNSTNPGGYSFRAIYSGDANNNGATSGCEPLTVNPVGVSIATTLSATTIPVGGTVSDNSTLHGQTSTAGGTVTYTDFANGNCAVPGTVVSIVNVSNGVVPKSRTVAFNSSGAFSFSAVYSGDANNNGATSGCESFSVSKASPAITTLVSPSSTITIGGSVTDQATLTGGFPATGVTGTVTYSLFSFLALPPSGSACSGGTIVGTSQTVSVGPGNSVSASSAVTPPSPGFYGFSAAYNGNGNNTVATGNCEPFTVNKQTPTVTTTINPPSSVVVGASIIDQATITGGFPSTGVSGSLTYRFFGLGNAVCSGTPASIQTVSVGTGNSVPPSNPQTPSSPGQYSFNATYNGDANNNQVTSNCEPLAVSPISTTTGVVCGSSVTVGVPTSCTITVSDTAPGTLNPTGTVNLITNSTGTFVPLSPCNLNGSTSSSSCTFTYTPGALGAHNITVTYPGDSNHKGSAGSAILSPSKHSTSVSVSCSSPILANQVSTCIATVTDTSAVGATTPTGSVGFTVTGVAGSFNVTSCALTGTGSTASCGVRFSPPASGTASIVGSYGGDSTHSISNNSSAPAQVTVNPSIGVNIPSATPSAIDSGQSANLSATFTGGTSPYTCQWLQKDPTASSYGNFGVSSACTSSASVSTGTLTTVGTWSFELQVTDSSSSPVMVLSAPATVAVNPGLLSPTIIVSPGALDLGQSAALTTTTAIGGGTPAYTCQWLAKAPGAASYGNLGSSFACIAGDKPIAPTGTLSTAGSWSFELKVTDNGSPAETGTSGGVPVTVNSPLSAPTISATPIVINSGQSSALSTITSFAGGTSTYSCQWLQKAPAATTYSSLGASFVCNVGDKPATPTSALSIIGIWSFELQVGDSGSPSEIVTSSAVTVTVNGPLSSGAISPNVPTIDAGQSITLAANPTGGTSPYTYQWYSDGTCGTPIASATTSTFNPSPASTSTYSVRVTDSVSSSACSTGDTVTVNPALAAGTVTPSTPTIDAGQSITLGVSPSGGTLPYHYQWYSGGSAICSSDTTLLGTVATQVVSPSVNTYFCYNITDSAFVPATQSSAADLVMVDSALAAGPITPLSPTIDSGQSITLTSNPSGGATPYSYQWYAAASCTTASLILGATSSTYVAFPASTINFFYKVTDSSQGFPTASQCSPGDLVTVNPALVAGAITPPNPTIDSGQLITLSSHASGGTPSLSYQWYSDGACTTTISSATLSTYSASPTSASTYSYKVTDSANSPTSQCSIADTVTVNPALVVGAITPASPSINSGQPVTLTANPSGGTVPYNYQWYSDGVCSTLIVSATSQTYSTSPTITATYSYKITDSSFSPISRCSLGDTVTVNSAIVAGAITPPNPTIDNGQSIQLTSHVSGGTSPFSYQWYSDGVCSALISGATQSTFTASPPATASYSYRVTDSAQSPASACSPANTVTVNAALTAAPITPLAPTIDAGQSIILTSHASGGTPSISYRWYSDGSCALAIPGATSSTYVTTPSVTTTYAYFVTDSAFSPISQCSLADTVNVNPALVANAISPSAPTIDNGQSVSLSASPTSGTTPYFYQWYSAANCLSGNAISGATLSTYSASPTSTTTYSYKAADSSQGSPIASSCSPSDTVTVSAGLSAGAITPSAPSIDSSQSVTLSANPSGGTTPYSYQWYGDGACIFVIASATSPTYLASPTATSAYSYKVTDSALSSQCSPADTVTVNPALVAGAITPTSPVIDNGQSITLTSAPSGGTTSYSYQWFAAGSCINPIGGATSPSYTTTPVSATAYSYRVTDSASSPVSRCSPDDIVTVSPALVAGAVTPSAPTINAGQSISLTANASGGTLPYSFQWFSGASGTCSLDTISLGTSATQSVSPTVNTYYCYTVTDFAFTHASQSSISNPVTVNTLLVAGAITPSSPTIDSGQSVILTAKPSGGTAPYSYQWYSGTSPNCSADTAPLGIASSQTVSSTTSAYYCYRVADSSSGSPSASASSSTDLVTVNAILSTPSLTATSPIVSGQSTTITVSWSGGNAPYTVTLYTSASSSTCTGLLQIGQNNNVASPTAFTQAPSATTNYCASVVDSAFSPKTTQTASSQTVVVNPVLSVTTPSPAPAIVDSGQSSTLSATFSGGTSPYTCQWLQQAPGATSFSSLGVSSSCTSPVSISTGTLATAGVWSFEIQVTDSSSLSVIVTSAAAPLAVNPPLAAPAISASPTITNTGLSSALSATVSFSGGTPAYTCQWLKKGPLDSSYGNLGSSFSCSVGDKPTASTGPLPTAGAWSFELQVNDHGSPSQLVASAAITVTVNGALSAGAISPGASSIDAGQSITLSANAFGGTVPYSYQWYGDGACIFVIASATSSTYVASPGISSIYSYRATDSASSSQCSPSDTVTVNPALVAGTAAPSSPAIDNGQSVTLTASPSLGTTPYSYQWYSASNCPAASLISGASSSAYAASPTSTSTYSYKVTDSSQGTPNVSQCSLGDLVSVSPALAAGSITPSGPSIDSGQSITLISHASGGTPSLSYQWYSDAACTTLVSGATLSTYLASATTTSAFSYRVTDSANSPVSLCSAGNNVTVNPTLVVGAVAPPNPSIDNGQSITLTANPSSGTTPYSYQWYSDGACSAPIASAISSTLLASPTATSTYTYKTTDSASSSKCSPSDTVTVNPAILVGAITPSFPIIDLGQSITLAANPSGGTTPYHYQWYSTTNPACPAGATIGLSPTLSVTPSANAYSCYIVSDSSAGSPVLSATSAAALVTVNPPLAPGSITPSSPTIDSGQSITLTANPSGGTTLYHYQWYSGSSPACSLDTTPLNTGSTQAVSPASSTYYCYRVTDSSIGSPTATATSVTNLVTVSPALVAGAITPSTPSIDNGQSIALIAKPSGGVLPETYQWYSDGICSTLIPSATSQTYTAAPSSITVYSYKVTDSANSPSSACSPGNPVNVNSALIAGSITPTNPSIDIGQPVTLASHASGGTPSLSYQWYSDGICAAAIPSATLSTYSVSLPSTTTFSYRVIDSSQGSPTGTACSPMDTVTVSLALVAGPIMPSGLTINNGQSITLTSAGSGGTTPYSYQWYSSSGCLSGNLIPAATSSILGASPSSTTTYSYKVTDSAFSPVSLCSSGDTVTVNPTLAARPSTPSSPTIDLGQVIVLISQASGGTPALSYQWYSDANCVTAITGATLPTYVASPTATTLYSYRVTDSATPPVPACSPADTVTVNTPLSAGDVTPALPAIDSGQSIVLMANPAGGTVPYHYQWYSSSSATCTSGTALGTIANVQVSPAVNTYYCYTVTDSSTGTPPSIATSTTDYVTVNPVLAVTAPSSTPPNLDSGQSSTLSATFRGGTSPYTCQWLQEAPGASSFNALGGSSPCTSTVSASTGTLTTVGTWSFKLQITDSSGSPVQVTSAAVTVIANAGLSSPTISVSPTTVDVGQSSTLAATASFTGGTSLFVCQWLEKTPGAASYSNIGSSFSCNPGDKPTASTGALSAAGAWSFELKVTDHGGPPQVVSSTTSMTVLAPPTLSVPGSQTITAGSTVTFVVNATGAGGCNAVTLASSELPTGASFVSSQCFAGSASSVFSWKPLDSQAPGDYKVTFTATDALGAVTSSQVTIHVSSVSKAAPLPIVSYSLFGIVGFSAVVAVAMILRRVQTTKRRP